MYMLLILMIDNDLLNHIFLWLAGLVLCETVSGIIFVLIQKTEAREDKICFSILRGPLALAIDNF